MVVGVDSGGGRGKILVGSECVDRACVDRC